MWGDLTDGNDQVFINDDGVNILTPEAASQDHMLSSLFLSDQDGEQDSDLTLIEDNVTQDVFIAGIDYYIPAATQPGLSDLSTISIQLISPTGDGASQIINVPNWPADRVRTVSVQFRDFVQYRIEQIQPKSGRLKHQLIFAHDLSPIFSLTES